MMSKPGTTRLHMREIGKSFGKVRVFGGEPVQFRGSLHAALRGISVIRQELSLISAIESIIEADMKWLESSTRSEMESARARFPEIGLVYAHNDPGAHGACLAAKAVSRENDIIFVGIEKSMVLSSRIYTKENLDEGGEVLPAPTPEPVD